MLTNSKVGRQEILLLSLSVVVTGVTADLLLGFFLPPTYVAQSKYGWKTPANVVQLSTIEDTTGQFREVTIRYFQNGFKRWGNTNTNKRKVFVLRRFIHRSEASFKWRGMVFLFGSVQQCRVVRVWIWRLRTSSGDMVLDDYIDSIHPDLILWQFCSDNHYGNSLYELELSGYPTTNHAVRPFLEDGRIVYRLALPYAKLRQYSYIADRLLKKYDDVMWRRPTQDRAAYDRRRAEHEAEDNVAARLKFLEAKAYYVTLEIMKKVKTRAKEIPIYLFNTCSRSSEYDQRLASETGIVILSGIAEYVNDNRDGRGRSTECPHEGHWNKLGNQLAGEWLVDRFRDLSGSKEIMSDPKPEKKRPGGD